MNYMPSRTFVATLLLMGVGLPSAVRAQDSPQASGAVTLFENVRIFDGKSATLSAPSNVLVRGNKIETISTPAHRGRSQSGHPHHRGRRPHADARPDRQSLARDAGARDSGTGVR